MTIIVKMHHQNGETETGTQFFTFEEYNHFEAETLKDIDKLIETGAFNYEFKEEDGRLKKAIFTPKVFENEPKFTYQFIYTIAYSDSEKIIDRSRKEEKDKHFRGTLYEKNGSFYKYTLTGSGKPHFIEGYDRNGKNLIEKHELNDIINIFNVRYKEVHEKDDQVLLKTLHGEMDRTYCYRLSRQNFPILMKAKDRYGDDLFGYHDVDDVLDSFYDSYEKLRSNLEAIEKEAKQIAEYNKKFL